ncbi:MAG: bifunctional adenosylcobinamide kinase/adenosylcobinamide-phosphate guanylyltransferase [Synergistetes bacterium]|nr:bifunctional adenosylcobinamide kinase/adenosylcobinamide-phosphate guanylyltransferase [Synergistota bacterium]MCX8127224.1 bifunctional adenosylcobinamide kinase/adenosylcobinamide-phosphate guanylyltransferase [Synergistota bacterium]MDW8191890.1 bifunctional adenosylcobinamide kinase/adenosylcobinamide-phosphate guanylyltransferase [Synergistota bacterium]
MIVLITGGIRSGKSSFAIKYALSKNYKKLAFLATGVPFDEEMKHRIEKHKMERSNLFETFEEPIYVPELLKQISPKYELIIVDCMTTYLANLYHYQLDVESFLNSFFETIKQTVSNLIIVTNEVGLSIIPENKLARNYMEKLADINKRIAHIANEVYFMISGIEVKIK